MPEKLSDRETQACLTELTNWSLEGGKLRQDFKFANFVQAFGFMTSAALEAEKLDHHPEWSNVYNKVVVYLVTHSADGITALDITLAKKMDDLAKKF
jgi:4a-hydroxytetrahydrobiopterin dehydratase